jgi:tetratricopeptide (TPR) repeat protein
MGSRGYAILVAPILALSVSTATGRAQEPPQCRHLSYRGNFRLNGAEQHLQQAEKTSFADEREHRLSNAMRLLRDAERAGGVDEPTLWYLFGRAYLIQNDLVGADSAFSKVEAVTDPECKQEIARLRRNAWVPLQNAGVEQMQAGNQDSAMVLLRRADRIYRDEPYAYLNMASIFADRDHADSAIAYYEKAANSTDDPKYADARETALFNAARLLHREARDSAGIRLEAERRGVPDSVVRDGRYQRALQAYQAVLQVRPRDLEAQASMAGVLVELHRPDQAKAIYDTMLAHADSMSSFDLFDAGVSLFRQQQYGLAAHAIELGLAKNRCHRDALYNLTNTFLAADDSVHMLEAARRLVAVDSMNIQSLRLLAAARQKNGDTQGTLRELLKIDSLKYDLTIMQFEHGDSTATLRGVVTNAQHAPMTGFKLTLEFVNGACEDVTTQQVDIPDLNPNGSPGASYDFNVTANGQGIVAWKYKTD